MKKYILIILTLVLGYNISFCTTKVTINQKLEIVTYTQLDSIIKGKEYSIVYYWPIYCTSCKKDIVSILQKLHIQNGTQFISVNETYPRPVISKKITFLNHDAKFFQLERHGREKLFSINDYSQVKYFQEYYDRSKKTINTNTVSVIYIMDKNLNVLYKESEFINADTVVNRMMDIVK